MGVGQIVGGVVFVVVTQSVAVGQDGLYPCERILQAEGVRYVELADVDGDADLDALVSGVGLSLYTWGPSGFELLQEVHEDLAYHSILVDVDADGALDAISVDSEDDMLAVRLGGLDGLLGTATMTPTAGEPVFVEAADLNADGTLDVLVSSAGDDELGVFHGDGLGGFVEFARHDVAEDPNTAIVADLDGDGTQDVILNHSSSWASTYTNSGAGLLTLASERQTVSSVKDMAVDDLDGDGQLDVLLVGCNGNLERSEVRADGVLQPFSVTYLGDCSGSPPWDQPAPAVATGDWNLDGKPDVAVTMLGKDLQLLLGNGRGDLTSWSDLDLLQSGIDDHFNVDASRIEVGDVDLDGRPELLLVNPGRDITFVRLDATGFAGIARVRDGVAASVVRAGDMDRDGLVDITVSGWFDTVGISVARGDGQGGLEAAAPVLAEGSELLELGDVNGDARTDVVTARYVDGVPILTTLTNLGGLAFVEEAVATLVAGPLDMEVADLDNDGALDVIVATSNDGAQVFRGIGDGSFAMGASFPLAPGTEATCVADFDEDGWIDFVDVEDNMGLAQLWYGGATGIVKGPAYGVLGFPDDVEAGDVDGDGHADLVVNGWLASAFVRRGAGDGTLGEAQSFSTGSSLDVYLADHDGDGDLEIFTASWSHVLTMSSWEGDGFEPTRTFAGAECSRDFVLADLDGQGALEIVMPRHASAPLTVLRGGP